VAPRPLEGPSVGRSPLGAGEQRAVPLALRRVLAAGYCNVRLGAFSRSIQTLSHWLMYGWALKLRP